MALKLNIKLDLKKIPKGARIAIAVAPAVIIAILFVVLVYMPKTKEVKNTECGYIQAGKRDSHK